MNKLTKLLAITGLTFGVASGVHAETSKYAPGEEKSKVLQSPGHVASIVMVGVDNGDGYSAKCHLNFSCKCN